MIGFFNFMGTLYGQFFFGHQEAFLPSFGKSFHAQPFPFEKTHLFVDLNTTKRYSVEKSAIEMLY